MKHTLGIIAFVLLLPWLAAAQAPEGGAPVRLDGKELFRIRHEHGSMSAAERAVAASDKLDDLALNPFRPAGSLELRNFDTYTELLYGDVTLLAVTDEDAASEGVARLQLANDRLTLVSNEVSARRAIYWHPRSLLLGLLYTAVFTVAFWLVMRFLRRRFAAVIAPLEGPGPGADWLREGGLLHRLHAHKFLSRFLRTLRTLFALTAVFAYLFVVMNFFPRTKYVAEALLDKLLYVLATVWSAFVGYVPNLLFLVVIVLIAYFATRLAKLFFLEVGKQGITLPGFDPDWAIPTYKIAVFLIVAFAGVMAFPYMPGSHSQAFQSVSLFLGLLISLASSSAISNVIAGVIITYTGGFRIGDRVRISDAMGDIVEVTLLVTRVRTPKNVIVAIPNAMVLTSHIVNYSKAARAEGLILHTAITIGYDAPWRTIHELLIAAASETVDVVDEPKPFVLQTALNDFYVSYELNAFTKSPSRMERIYSELHQRIQDKFNEAGVEIMSPHFSALREGNQIAIPGEYVPENYAAPAFRVASAESQVDSKAKGDGG